MSAAGKYPSASVPRETKSSLLTLCVWRRGEGVIGTFLSHMSPNKDYTNEEGTAHFCCGALPESHGGKLKAFRVNK